MEKRRIINPEKYTFKLSDTIIFDSAWQDEPIEIKIEDDGKYLNKLFNYLAKEGFLGE